MNETVCFYCKGDMEASHSTHFTELDNCMVIIKHVPCFKCSQCGEVVYTMTVVKQLEKIVNQMRTAITEVAIVIYSTEVA